MTDDPRYLNADCPYCGKVCRIGMIHQCERIAQGKGWVEIRWIKDEPVAVIVG